MIPTFLQPEVLPYVSVEIIASPAPLVCCYCPTFDPTVPAPGVSHGICAICLARVLAPLFPDGVRT